MASLNSRKAANSKVAKTASDIIVRRSKRKVKAAPMLTEDIAPAGRYRSEIISVTDAKSDLGKLMVDVTYRLTDDRGKAVDARIRYPAEGYHIERLFDALIDAGLPEESPMTDAVGIIEEVEIVYPFEGALGKIKSRRPADEDIQVAAKRPSSKKTVTHRFNDEEDEPLVEDDDDDEDFLEDED